MSKKNYQKEYRKLKKLLKKAGFVQETQGNHPKFRSPEGILVTCIQNCKDHRNAWADVLRNVEKAKIGR